MIKYACRPPVKNVPLIEKQGLPMLGFNSSPITEFGIKISSKMAEVSGRMLKSPVVTYQNLQMDVADGSWNIRNATFRVPVTITNFAVLCIASEGFRNFRSKDDPALGAFIKKLIAGCRISGLTIPDEPLEISYVTRTSNNRGGLIDNIERAFSSFSLRPEITFVFISNPDIYPSVKKLCDMKLGVHTACMLMSNVKKERGQKQFIANVVLKINAKLGGVNHSLDQPSLAWLEDTMLVGMDVTHPSFGTPKGAPSIAAVVASRDNNFFHYPVSLRLQSRQDVSPGVFKRQEVSSITISLISTPFAY